MFEQVRSGIVGDRQIWFVGFKTCSQSLILFYILFFVCHNVLITHSTICTVLTLFIVEATLPVWEAILPVCLAILLVCLAILLICLAILLVCLAIPTSWFWIAKDHSCQIQVFLKGRWCREGCFVQDLEMVIKHSRTSDTPKGSTVFPD